MSFIFRMSSAAMLGQEWSFDQDLGTVSISLVGLEKHSRPKNLRSKITVENGPPGLQVKFCLKEFSKKFLTQYCCRLNL